VIISLSRWPVSVFISKTGEKSVGSKFGNFRTFSIERRDWLTRTGPPVETAPRIYVEGRVTMGCYTQRRSGNLVMHANFSYLKFSSIHSLST
jgi:hypothetical protein